MDAVHFGQVFAFTAVDIFSRDAEAPPRPGLQSMQTDGDNKFVILVGEG